MCERRRQSMKFYVVTVFNTFFLWLCAHQITDIEWAREWKKSLAWIILFREWFWPAAAACIICGGRARIWMEKIEKQEIQKLHNIQFSHNVNSTDTFSTFYRTAAWIQQSNKLRNILMETAPGLLLMKTKFHLNRMCEKKSAAGWKKCCEEAERSSESQQSKATSNGTQEDFFRKKCKLLRAQLFLISIWHIFSRLFF